MPCNQTRKLNSTMKRRVIGWIHCTALPFFLYIVRSCYWGCRISHTTVRSYPGSLRYLALPLSIISSPTQMLPDYTSPTAALFWFQDTNVSLLLARTVPRWSGPDGLLVALSHPGSPNDQILLFVSTTITNTSYDLVDFAASYGWLRVHPRPQCAKLPPLWDRSHLKWTIDSVVWLTKTPKRGLDDSERRPQKNPYAL